MLLILARHGNTFGPDDTPVWVGANEDLPLVEKGLQQSRQVGLALREAGMLPDRIIAGPLKRTRIGAELAGEACGYSGEIETDERLREIDYGVWGGKSDEEIAAQWGEDAITQWRERSIPPRGAGWRPDPTVLAANARAVFETASRDRGADIVVLIMTSNGVLRYFHSLLAGPNAPETEAKVKTGHMGAAHIDASGFKLLFWNQRPGSPGAALA